MAKKEQTVSLNPNDFIGLWFGLNRSQGQQEFLINAKEAISWLVTSK